MRAVSALEGVQLNAVAHDGYTSMFAYLRSPTAKKPLPELDPEPYFSEYHPQGEALRKLLRMGAHLLKARTNLAPTKSQVIGPPPVRSHFATVFNWVVDNGLRGQTGAMQLQVDAVEQLLAGNARLLEFCHRHQHDLEDKIDHCWTVAGASQRLARCKTLRRDLLLQAATPGGLAAHTCAN